MATNDFQPFAYGGAANVVSQSAYIALTSILQNGFSSGVAQSAQLNKVWRQSSIMAAVLAQFSSDYSGQNSTDDGTTATLETNLIAAIRSVTKTGVLLADTGAANAYTASNIPALTSGQLVNGLVQQIVIAHANTGASTYAPDGLTAYPIYGLGLQALQGGELYAGGTAVLMRATIAGINGGSPIWVLMECAGGAQQIAPATQSQHAVQLGQVSNTYAVRGLMGQNNATTPTTQYDVSCNLVVLRNPTLGNTQAVSNPGTITNNIATAGPVANGRDQASAFPASNWVHFYYIWNGTTLATISSLTAPPTGPALPNGYTHWAYIGAVILTGSSTLNSVHMRGSRIRYDGTQNAVVGGSATTQTAVGLNPLIPPNALMFTLSIRELAGSADGTGKLDLVLHLGVISGSDYDAKHFGIAGVTSGTSQFSAPGTVDMPNVGQNYYYYMTQANGTGPSTTHLVLGYTVPNGDA